jgi:tRNA(fMet)-specific endonuclease VapC
MRYMLDTDTLIYVLNARPRHEAVLQRFDREPRRDLVVSAITLAELRLGIAKSRRREAARLAMQRVCDGLCAVPFEETAAARYGVVRATLEASGSPIGPLDTLIAAHALSLHLVLVTGNLRAFRRVPGLRCESWLPG